MPRGISVRSEQLPTLRQMALTPRLVFISLRDSPWFWMWSVLLLSSITLSSSFNLGFGSTMVQGFSVLLLLLAFQERGRLPAIAMIAFMSFGLTFLDSSSFVIDFDRLMSGLLIYRFALDPPTFLRMVRDARIGRWDYLVFAILILVTIGAEGPYGSISYNFNTLPFWGFALLAVLAWRGAYVFLSVLCLLSLLFVWFGFLPVQRSGDWPGIYFGVGWKLHGVVIIGFSTAVLWTLFQPGRLAAIGWTAAFCVAVVSHDLVFDVTNVIGLLVPTILTIPELGLTMPMTGFSSWDSGTLMYYLFAAPFAWVLLWLRSEDPHMQVALFIALVFSAIYLFVLRDAFVDGGGLLVDSDATWFFVGAFLATTLGVPVVWRMYRDDERGPLRNRLAFAWCLSMGVGVLVQQVMTASFLPPGIALNLNDDTFRFDVGTVALEYLPDMIVSGVLFFCVMAFILQVEFAKIWQAIRPEVNRDDFSFEIKFPRKNPSPIAPVLRQRFAMLERWIEHSDKGEPAPSLIDAMLGPYMRWVILSVTAFAFAIWCVQVIEIGEDGAGGFVPIDEEPEQLNLQEILRENLANQPMVAEPVSPAQNSLNAVPNNPAGTTALPEAQPETFAPIENFPEDRGVVTKTPPAQSN